MRVFSSLQPLCLNNDNILDNNKQDSILLFSIFLTFFKSPIQTLYLTMVSHHRFK
ncbi:hypothetical protein Hanom_Chr00s079140g01792871 [Helianthus anomalus]